MRIACQFENAFENELAPLLFCSMVCDTDTETPKKVSLTNLAVFSTVDLS